MMKPDFYPSPVYNKPEAGLCNRTATDGGRAPTFVHKITIRKIQVNLIEWCKIFQCTEYIFIWEESRGAKPNL